MRAIVQRVSEASVSVKENESLKEINKIGKGLVVLIGVGKEIKRRMLNILRRRFPTCVSFPMRTIE